MTKTISICSGKGGTGKTIISACLAYLLYKENKKILLIDGDLSVRGLSALLYLDSGSRKLTDGISLSDLINKDKAFDFEEDVISFVDYRGLFKVLPSSKRIDDIIKYDELLHLSPDIESRLSRYLSIIKNEYDFDYIIIDSRAGTDSTTLAFAKISDVIILVGEDDEISTVTTKNYDKDLETYIPNVKKYLLNNKSRRFREKTELGFDNMGIIPFDMDVVNSYGKKDFWINIDGTNYYYRLAQSWNRLAKWEQFDSVEEPAVRGIDIITKSDELGQFAIRDRIAILIGAIITLGSFILGSYIVISGLRFGSNSLIFVFISGILGVFLMTGHLLFPKILGLK